MGLRDPPPFPIPAPGERFPAHSKVFRRSGRPRWLVVGGWWLAQSLPGIPRS